MSLDARIPEMTEKELENLQANAERIIKTGAAKQKDEAERLLPLIADALVELRKNKLAAAAEKKVTRQKDMAASRARRIASRKAEAEAAAAPVHRLEELAVVLGRASLSSRNSIASMRAHRVEDAAQHVHLLELLRRREQLFLARAGLGMSIAGKTRLSATLRSRMISELPVPLNSSKMTSSMREPVSISAVAMMVSEPPSSMLRAAPKKRFGRCSALASTPPVSTLPDDGTTVL
jgi:hypothetical protein